MLFREADEQHIAVGEASVMYLFSRTAVPQIEKVYSGARYIVMLRNPIEMAYSLHAQMVFAGEEHIVDFYTAWKLSPERRAGRRAPRWCRDPRWLDYQHICKLGDQLERLFNIVPRQRVLVLVLDDIREDPRRECLKTLDFLGVPDDGRRDFPVKNPGKKLKWPHLHTAILAIEKAVGRMKRKLGIPSNRGTGILQAIKAANVEYQPRPPLAKEVREELVRYYRSDIERLERLVRRDFSKWLELD